MLDTAHLKSAAALPPHCQLGVGVGAFAVRVAGLPASVLESLRCPHAADCISEILRLEQWIVTEASEICDDLHRLIGDLDRPDLKPRMVGLRRAIFAGRRLPPSVLDEETRQALPGPLNTRVHSWVQRLAARNALRGQLRDTLSADVAAAAASLRETLSSPTMQLALVFSNPDAFADARRWIARPGTRSADKTAVRMAKYVSRAAAKTSPLTLFTSSGLGSWHNGGPILELDTPEPHSTAELGVALLYRVIGALVSRPSAAAHMLVRTNPTAAVDGDTVRFVAPGMSGSVRALRLSPAMRALLSNLDDECTLQQLRHALAAKSGDPERGARTIEFVDRLLRAGLLELYVPIPDQKLDPGTLLEWLERHAEVMSDDTGDFARLRDTLRTLTEHLHAYARTSAPAERLVLRNQLEAEVTKLSTSSGIERDMRLSAAPRVFYENGILPGETLVADLQQWAPALEDLAAVGRFAALYDPGLPARLLLPRFIAERYGDGAHVPFLRFFAAYESELGAGEPRSGMTVHAEQLDPARSLRRAFSRQTAEEMEATAIGGLNHLGRLRREASTLFRSAPLKPGEILEISPNLLPSALGQFDSVCVREQESLACYVQPYIDRDQPRLALNMIGFGMGTGRTRVSHLMRKRFGDYSVIGEGGRPLTDPGGPIYAEVESAFGSGLNQRDQAVEHVLTYPGSVSARSPSRRISLGDLVIVHDPISQRVRLEWRKTGREVVPVHLGLLAVPMLPPVLHFLVSAFSHTSFFFTPSLFTTVEMMARGSAAHSGSSGVSAWPRVQVGHVTLRRAGWWAPSTEVPRRSPGDGDEAYLLSLARWRSKVGVPERCFVRVMKRPWTGASPSGLVANTDNRSAAPAPWMSKELKPMYIDFASCHLAQVFERMLGDQRANVMFEEVLPDFEAIPRATSGERRALELIVETQFAKPLRDASPSSRGAEEALV